VDYRARTQSFRDLYRQLAVEWDQARDDPAEANRLFDKLQVAYKGMRDSPEGRDAILGLLKDAETPVQLLAATHSLAWDPTAAERVLTEIEQQDNMHAVTAKWTLRSFRAGKLNLDW
jgi:hypothetical protein